MVVSVGAGVDCRVQVGRDRACAAQVGDDVVDDAWSVMKLKIRSLPGHVGQARALPPTLGAAILPRTVGERGGAGGTGRAGPRRRQEKASRRSVRQASHGDDKNSFVASTIQVGIGGCANNWAPGAVGRSEASS